MIAFLTSSPTGPLDHSRTVRGLDPLNDFPRLLAARMRPSPRCLMVSAFPDDAAANDQMRAFFAEAFSLSGLPCACFDIWDARTGALSREAVQGYDTILLGGGHVPTQNAFFARIGLAEKLAGFDGVVIGISAGSMNAARLVYAQPEKPGEADDPAYRRFLPGLGITETMILPHYQMLRGSVIDGRRLFEDITYPDSMGRRFLALCDGSFLLCENGTETVFGEAYQIADGQIRPAEGTSACVS